MPSVDDHRELAFEAAIEHHLLNVAGYANADAGSLTSQSSFVIHRSRSLGSCGPNELGTKRTARR